MGTARISQESLHRINAKLQETYGDRLKGVMYGSEARGEATEDSDIDLLVLLEGPLVWWKELRVIIHALYPIQLEVIRPISAKPVDIETYRAAEYPLYRNVMEEGVLL